MITQESPYTGCRGTVVDDPGARPGTVPLGYYVAIDGENGRTHPFLTEELLRLVAARARRRESDLERKREA